MELVERFFLWILMIFVFVEVFMVQYSQAQLHSDVRNLYKNLTANYQKEILPIHDFSQPFTISFLMVPLVLNSFKETEEVISVTMATNFMWNDSNLVWDPSHFGGVTNITMMTDSIWLPKFHLQNNAENMKPIGHESAFYVVVKYDGQVDWIPGEILKAKCPTNILRFPFDTQECTFLFTMWGCTGIKPIFSPMMPNGLMNYYTENSDWDVTETLQKFKDDGEISEFIFTMKIKRKPTYYVVVIVLPTLMFCLLNPLVFLLPIDSGERVSLGMTILLSYAIFLTIVAGSLPATSSPMCLLLFIMIMIMMVSGLIVVFVIISLYFHHKDNTSSKYIVRSGREISARLDTVCMVVSYLLLIASMVGYFIFIAAS